MKSELSVLIRIKSSTLSVEELIWLWALGYQLGTNSHCKSTMKRGWEAVRLKVEGSWHNIFFTVVFTPYESEYTVPWMQASGCGEYAPEKNSSSMKGHYTTMRYHWLLVQCISCRRRCDMSQARTVVLPEGKGERPWDSFWSYWNSCLMVFFGCFLFLIFFLISSFVPQPFLHLGARSSLMPSCMMQPWSPACWTARWWKIHPRVFRKLVDY